MVLAEAISSSPNNPSCPVIRSRCFQGRIHDGQHLAPAQAEAIESTAFDQGFHHPLVHFGKIHPAGEIKEIFEGAPFLPFFQDHGNRCIPHALDGSQAEPDGVPIHGKASFAGIDVRGEHFDIHIPADTDVPAHLVRHGDDAVQESRHVFYRIVGFQPGGLISY